MCCNSEKCSAYFYDDGSHYIKCHSDNQATSNGYSSGELNERKTEIVRHEKLKRLHETMLFYEIYFEILSFYQNENYESSQYYSTLYTHSIS